MGGRENKNKILSEDALLFGSIYNYTYPFDPSGTKVFCLLGSVKFPPFDAFFDSGLRVRF